MARKRKTLTEEQVKQCAQMAALKMPHEYMAAILGVPHETFKDMLRRSRTLRDTLSAARANSNHAVRVTLYHKACGRPAEVDERTGVVLRPAIEPDFQAMKFWAETQEGFKKTQIMELPGLTEEENGSLRPDDMDGRIDKLMEKVRARREKGYGKTGKSS